MRPSQRRGLFVAAAAAALLPSAASAADSPSKVLVSIVTAADAQRSVHYTSDGNYGKVEVSFVADAGVDSGVQQITYRKGGTTGHVTVIVTGDTAYIRGDAFTLLNYIGFKSSAALDYADRWVRFPHTDENYEVVAAGVTLSSAIDEIKLGGQLSNVPKTNVEGQQVLGVKATFASSSGTTVDILYARAAGSPLPVQEVASRGSMRLNTTYSQWNESVVVVAPKSSTPIAVVRKIPSGPIA
jgi:hypothetical protein